MILDRSRPSRKMVLIFAISIVSLLLILVPVTISSWRHHLRAKVRRSAEDILVLWIATATKSNDLAQFPLLPDRAFASPESRRQYDIPDSIPQDLVAECDRKGIADPGIQKTLLESRGEYLRLQLRLFDWKGLVYPFPYILVADKGVREGLPEAKVISKMRRNVDGLREYDREYESLIPLDPFASGSPSRLNRYDIGLHDGKRAVDPARDCWIIAGNGPDGDADVDVSNLRVDPLDPKGEWFAPDPRTGRERPLMELTYDPTNGLVSDGDLFVIGNDKATDLRRSQVSFKKRYGL